MAKDKTKKETEFEEQVKEHGITEVVKNHLKEEYYNSIPPQELRCLIKLCSTQNLELSDADERLYVDKVMKGLAKLKEVNKNLVLNQLATDELFLALDVCLQSGIDLDKDDDNNKEKINNTLAILDHIQYEINQLLLSDDEKVSILKLSNDNEFNLESYIKK